MMDFARTAVGSLAFAACVAGGLLSAGEQDKPFSASGNSGAVETTELRAPLETEGIAEAVGGLTTAPDEPVLAEHACWQEGCAGAASASCGTCASPQVGCCQYGSFVAAFDFAVLSTHFEDNRAFTVMESDGVSFEAFSDTEFDYKLELSPRVWVGFEFYSGLGLRAGYWHYDQAPAIVSASPPANGFGRVSHPVFGDVDIGSTVPTDTFTAATDLDAFVIDFEATKSIAFGSWTMQVSGGLRYASIEQSYLAGLESGAGVARGAINFSHRLQGAGPTVSLAAFRPITPGTTLFALARGSLLYGEGKSHLAAGEDLDLANPLFTTKVTERDDVLPIGEIQVGVQWSGYRMPYGGWTPFLRLAAESQLWSGAGSASGEDGDLEFVGFNAGVGCLW